MLKGSFCNLCGSSSLRVDIHCDALDDGSTVVPQKHWVLVVLQFAALLATRSLLAGCLARRFPLARDEAEALPAESHLRPFYSFCVKNNSLLDNSLFEINWEMPIFYAF
ncbi:hypothetical protein [Lentibacillus halodurans]|uniref:hypothetical protein n=1 Tax=Lentibacillus halodurans TaxID=237679 RepID=UPI001BAB1341|nr:hypothetical protein [Lentibacillus halodurans]